MKRKVILSAMFFVLIVLVYVSCSPTVKVEGPDKPIEINVNVRIDIYRHIASTEKDIYGDYLNDNGNDESPGGDSLLRGFFMPAAYGATSGNSAYEEARKRRAGRASEIIKAKREGGIGEDRRGLVSVIEQNEKIKNDSEYAAKIRKLAKEENEDREIMFESDAKRKGISVNIIREEMARFWRDNSKPGEWIEVKDSEGKWIWKRK